MSNLSFEQRREMLELGQAHEKEMYRQGTERERELGEKETELAKLRADELVKQREIEYEKLRNEQKLELDRQARDYQLQIERLKFMAEGRLSVDGGRERDRPGDLVSNLRLLPKFNERDPEVFFRGWPSSDRTIMLQSVLVGRAQEAYTALSGEDRKVYTKLFPCPDLRSPPFLFSTVSSLRCSRWIPWIKKKDRLHSDKTLLSIPISPRTHLDSPSRFVPLPMFNKPAVDFTYLCVPCISAETYTLWSLCYKLVFQLVPKPL
ncbi:uncharacterized protein LOC131525960 [Onychostoma macrolepis]|uniref:uncharacterized protein LOC131525960 n=1 Tax=Onychostoma macrolepis TaxID=369639 RepID=UPI00272C33E3|nr:uncharacterized protein LOC131525960 [Onychostoma macrolepis]